MRLFRGRGGIDGFLMRVGESGGRLSQPKTRRDGGHSAAGLTWFYDTKGHLLGIHAPG